MTSVETGVAPTAVPELRSVTPAGNPSRRRKRPTLWGWEFRRLIGLTRTRVLLVVCVTAPFVFVAILAVQPVLPADTLFGVQVTTSGYAVPLLLLGFATTWALPAVAATVGGDLFSMEDRHGTWPLLASRSRSRGEIARGKLVAGALLTAIAVSVLALSGLLAGITLVGRTPLRGLSGQPVAGGHAVALILAAYALVLLPTGVFLALAVLLSAVTRSGAVGIAGPVVVGLGLQSLSLVTVPGPVRLLLPTAALDAWHGLFTEPQLLGPAAWAVPVSLVWIAVLVALTSRVVQRRDLTGA